MTNDIKQINTADNQGHGLHLDSSIMTYIYEGGTRTVKWVLDKIFELLNGKAASVHTHTKSQITDFAHTHAQSDVTGLASALDEKAPLNNPSFTGNVNIGGGLTVGNGSVHGNGDDESLYLASHGESAYIDLTEDGGAGAIELNAATVKGSAVADTAAKLEAGGAKIPTAEVIKDALDGKLSLLDSFEITNSGIYGVITGTVGNINTYLLLVSVSTRSSAGQPSTVIRKQTRISDSIESRTKVNDGEWSEWE